MENMKSARYKDGKVPDPEEVMRRMAAKYGGAAAVSTEPKQAIAQPKPAKSATNDVREYPEPKRPASTGDGLR